MDVTGIIIPILVTRNVAADEAPTAVSVFP
jgi:hypothetical protein